MYEHAIQYFLHALKCESIGIYIYIYIYIYIIIIIIYYTNYLLDEVHGDKAKASVRGQCDKYLVRAEELKEYIRKKKKKSSKMIEGGGSSSKSKKK